MSFDDQIADGQPQSGSPDVQERVRPVESLKEVPLLLFRHPQAIILNTDLHLPDFSKP